MPKINELKNKFSWVYIAGFFIVLALPVLIWPPYFFPADWGKTIVFRSVMAIMLFLFLWQFFYQRNKIGLPSFSAQGGPASGWKNNKIIWALGALFVVYLFAGILSVDPLFSFWGSPYRGGGLVDFIFYFVFAVLAFILFKKEDWKKAFDFSIIIGVLVSLIGIIQYFGLFNNFFLAVPSRPASTMGNTDILALYLLLLSFITLSYTIKENKIRLKALYSASLAIFLFTLLITGSRAGFFGLLIGGIYFFLAYPKKVPALKIGAVVLLVVVCGVVIYANTINQYPKFLENNRLFNSVESRLSVKLITNDPRFAAWQIELNAIKSKPVLGYGPENFAVGFDKYYDPSIPYLNRDTSWYDKAHNIILQTGVEAGILGIIAYLGLFVTLFWQLQKNKNIIAHGIQATLLGYLAANLFGFDSFGTYIILFLLIAYSLYLTSQNNTQNPNQNYAAQKNNFWKSALMFVLFLVLVIFLWQYNYVPLQINAEINKSENLANQKQCTQAFSTMDNIFPEHSFLDSYSIAKYVTFEKTCSAYYPENILSYTKKGVSLLNDAVKIQPLYTRYWIYLGTLTTTLAEQEQDLTAKNNLIEQAKNYFSKALQLAPKHQEIFTGLAKLEIDAGNYKSSQNYSEQCIALNSDLGDCYWYLGLAEIYAKDNTNAEKNIQTASIKGYNINTEANLDDLVNAYGRILDYKNLVPVLEKLVIINPNDAQYRTYLNYVNSKNDQ